MHEDRETEMDDLFGVGTTTHESVRLWWRCEDGGPFTVELARDDSGDAPIELRVPHLGGAATDWTMSVEIPGEVDGAETLEPSTRYRLRVCASDGHTVGEGRFRTAPDPAEAPAEPWSFAVMSCHQPFDDDGEVHDDARRMLRVLEPALEEIGVSYVLLVGDQMYVDLPPSQNLHDPGYFRTIARHGEECLLDCTEDEALYHFHGRYRRAWRLPELGELQSNRPTDWILDDHEIVDNWGTDPAHLGEAWQKVVRAARRSFLHYQGGHQRPITDELPPSFHHAFRWGDTATFVTDMRSRRRTSDDGSVVLGDAQLEDLERFLQESSDARVVFVVLTVPIMHLPESLTDLGATITGAGSDFEDRWEWGPNTLDRDHLLELLREHQRRHPDQRMVMLSGDIHVGCALELEWDDEGVPPIHQLVSSAVTNVLERPMGLAVKLATMLVPKVELEGHTLEGRFLKAVGKDQRNPLADLNVGIVDVIPDGDRTRLRFRLLTHPDDDESTDAVVGFDSGEL